MPDHQDVRLGAQDERQGCACVFEIDGQESQGRAQAGYPSVHPADETCVEAATMSVLVRACSRLYFVAAIRLSASSTAILGLNAAASATSMAAKLMMVIMSPG